MPEELAARYADCGVDVLELGVPSADPYLDGATVSASMARARAAGVGSEGAAVRMAALRRRLPEQASVAVVYADDGVDLGQLAATGEVDGLLALGAAEERSPAAELGRRGIHAVGFVPFHFTPAQAARSARASGYVMLQAAPGVTGKGGAELPDRSEAIAELRAAGVRKPIVLGIGISAPEQAEAAVTMGADGVVIGSATVEAGLEGPDVLRRFLLAVATAVHGGRD